MAGWRGVWVARSLGSPQDSPPTRFLKLVKRSIASILFGQKNNQRGRHTTRPICRDRARSPRRHYHGPGVIRSLGRHDAPVPRPPHGPHRNCGIPARCSATTQRRKEQATPAESWGAVRCSWVHPDGSDSPHSCGRYGTPLCSSRRNARGLLCKLRAATRRQQELFQNWLDSPFILRPPPQPNRTLTYSLSAIHVSCRHLCRLKT